MQYTFLNNDTNDAVHLSEHLHKWCSTPFLTLTQMMIGVTGYCTFQPTCHCAQTGIQTTALPMGFSDLVSHSAVGCVSYKTIKLRNVDGLYWNYGNMTRTLLMYPVKRPILFKMSEHVQWSTQDGYVTVLLNTAHGFRKQHGTNGRPHAQQIHATPTCWLWSHPAQLSLYPDDASILRTLISMLTSLVVLSRLAFWTQRSKTNGQHPVAPDHSATDSAASGTAKY